VSGVDPVQVARRKTEGKDGLYRFRDIPAIPIGLAEPIAQARVLMLDGKVQSDRADQGLFRLEDDGEMDGLAGVVVLLLMGDPFLRGAVGIGMGHEECALGHVLEGGQLSHAGGIADLKVTEP
jgi:hypothetical protein